MAGFPPPLQAAISDERGTALGVLMAVSVVYLLLAFLAVRRGRSLDLTLVVLGLLTGVLAEWCGLLGAGEAAQLQARAAQPGGVSWAVAGGASGALGRVAVLLVLGGVAVAFAGRWTQPPTPAGPEEVRRGDPL